MPALHGRALTLGEEIANSISHGLGFVGVMIAAPFVLRGALHQGGAAALVGAIVFLASAALLYITSTLYHALPGGGRVAQVFQRLDHSAIYVFIAGTYTPFLLGPLRGGWGWALFGVIWALAALGVVLKSVFGARQPLLSTLLYVGMGWLVVIAARPLIQHVPFGGLMWLLAGGLAHTFGAVFFMFDHRIRYGHFVWHLFVLAGTACHFVAVFRYATGSVR